MNMTSTIRRTGPLTVIVEWSNGAPSETYSDIERFAFLDPGTFQIAPTAGVLYLNPTFVRSVRVYERVQLEDETGAA